MEAFCKRFLADFKFRTTTKLIGVVGERGSENSNSLRELIEIEKIGERHSAELQQIKMRINKEQLNSAQIRRQAYRCRCTLGTALSFNTVCKNTFCFSFKKHVRILQKHSVVSGHEFNLYRVTLLPSNRSNKTNYLMKIHQNQINIRTE